MLEIFHLASEAKFDLGGQKSFQEILGDIIKEVVRKRILWISVMVLELCEFKIFILASKVIFDLGGQRSFFSICVELAYRLVCYFELFLYFCK